MKRLIGAALLLSATGCATNNYEQYAAAQQKIAESKASADIARVQALASIAQGGDSAARVAATMALAMDNKASTQPQQSVQAPKDASDTVLQWMSVILPSVVQGYGIYSSTSVAKHQSNASRDVSIVQSNNNAAVAQNTNSMIENIAQNDPVVVTTEKVVPVTNQEAVIVNPVVVTTEKVVPINVETQSGTN